MMPARTLLAASLLLALAGCGREAPPAARLEALAMTAAQSQSAEAERQLRHWAARGAPVAQRELGLLYASRAAKVEEARIWLTKAALQNDAQAACALGDLARATSTMAGAWTWYEQAALLGHARAALMLGLMARNGEGTERDPTRAQYWLTRGAERGNAHAMFALSNMLRDGEAGPADAARAHEWLEQAAEHEYPAALQELAMQSSDALQSSHLLKEANEHRQSNWNRF
ncbi:MAG: tetratricopeptide repeat protein [Massilia sp.]